MAFFPSFTPRYLSSFPTFDSFYRRDKFYKQSLAPDVYQELSYRMVLWYGCQGDVEDYQVWALARVMEMEKNQARPICPEDLRPRVRQEWLSRLDECKTLEEAETVVSGEVKRQDGACLLCSLQTTPPD